MLHVSWGGGVLEPCLLHFQTHPACFKGLHPPCQRHTWQTALGLLHWKVNRQEFSRHRETSFHPGVPDSVTPNSKAKPPWERFDQENSQIILASVRVQGGYRWCPRYWWEVGDGPQVEAPAIRKQVWESPGRSPSSRPPASWLTCPCHIWMDSLPVYSSPKTTLTERHSRGVGSFILLTQI